MLAVGDFHSKRFTFYDGVKKGTSGSEVLPVTHPTLLFMLPIAVRLNPKVALIVQVTHNGLAFISRLQSFKSWALRQNQRAPFSL